MSSKLKVVVHDSFDGLPQTARNLCASVARDRWFDSLEWFRCLHETALANAVRLRIYVVMTDSAEAIACLFCCTHKDREGELASLSNYYTMEFAPLVAAAADTARIATALASFIAAERPRWHTLRFDYLKASNTATLALIGAVEQAGYAAHRHHQYDNWYLDCPDTRFETYFAARPSRLRNTIERKGRKLYKSHQVEIKLYRRPEDDIERGMRDWVTIYNSSWKQPEPHPDFMPELARRLAALDCLRLGVLYVDGQPAAAQFWIMSRNEACIYKLAYDEKYAEMSVGAVLSREMFKQALDDDRVPRIDYGVGSESYKQEWMSGMQEIFGVRAYSRRSVRGLALIGKEKLKTVLKRRAAQSK